ncbi:MAG: hypothetical protein GYB19_19505 [Rhodospirillales bacterium]|nr:hypothetical protein [Rhodospirillales bacterium]
MDDKAKADWVFDFSQRCLAEHPVLVVGSGASAAHSLPTMGQLADYLIEKIEADGVPADAEDVWARFKEVVFEQGLEQAIDEALLWRHEKLYNTLRLLTWECVRGPEEIVRSLATADKAHIPLCKLITYLFRSHHRKISIVTTNYDRIPEYAVDCVDACAWTGFHGSYFGRWLGFSPPLEFWRSNKRVQQNTVEILKVHGSLDWFMNSAKQPVRLIGIDKVPVDHSALIVPPSLRKSEEVLMAPLRDILAHTDYTLSNANGFFASVMALTMNIFR